MRATPAGYEVHDFEDADHAESSTDAATLAVTRAGRAGPAGTPGTLTLVSGGRAILLERDVGGFELVDLVGGDRTIDVFLVGVPCNDLSQHPEVERQVLVARRLITS